MHAGYRAEEIYRIFKKYCKQINYVSIKNMLKLILGLVFKGEILIQGLNDGKKLESLIKELCSKKGIYNINQVKMPLVIPSVDLHNGRVYVFSSVKTRGTYNDKNKYINDARIDVAVRSSCSYPGVFSPCKYKGTELIDGGIRENVPWKEFKLVGADKVISVVFEENLKEDDYVNIIEVVCSAIGILSHELSNYELAGADELIKIKSEHISLLDSSKIDYLYNLGYEKAKRFIKSL